MLVLSFIKCVGCLKFSFLVVFMFFCFIVVGIFFLFRFLVVDIDVIIDCYLFLFNLFVNFKVVVIGGIKGSYYCFIILISKFICYEWFLDGGFEDCVFIFVLFWNFDVLVFCMVDKEDWLEIIIDYFYL